MNSSQARRNLIARQRGEHQHDFAQILIGWRGRMDCEFTDTAGRLVPGSAALVPASSCHRFEGLSDNSELLVVDVSLQDPYIRALEQACRMTFEDTLFNRPEFLSLGGEMAPLLEFAATQLAAGKSSDNALLRCQLVSLFMTQFCRLYSAKRAEPLIRQRINPVILHDFIDSRLAEPLTNRELAQALNLSESHFYCLFQRQFGVTPQQYVVSRRLRHARTQLLDSALPLVAIAAEVGFADASSFNRAYKREFRETPGATRRDLKA
ncbi:AraC family transcriptional regulator [Marinobacterium zhoushanense]|uniref:AraC family transcriptional regulator n=1 Tax=Marinobacterium zhoushanense TaxID=1679163 RepID=A0ABQ1K6R8_9GAMM|nr:AraC family transcriptional regulator [Marinobacterium zhoushanense]GGB88445.1 AraC family transcriptional regulator [Marinobacterium zhoushanense]